MSGASRRAEEQGYYQVDDERPAVSTPSVPERSIAEVCAESGHKLSQTMAMRSCACGKQKAEADEAPSTLF